MFSESEYDEYFFDTVWGMKMVNKILKYHNISKDEFISDFGVKENYPAPKVLAWLGY